MKRNIRQCNQRSCILRCACKHISCSGHAGFLNMVNLRQCLFQAYRRWYIKLLCFILFIFYLLSCLILSQSALANTSKKNYWVERYNALSPQDHPLIPETMAIFNKVLAAADKRENRYPSLVILENKKDIFALSLMDGTILISQRVMEFCFADVDFKTGASRMAFVLGHELAHLAKDDFWQFEAIDTITRYGFDQNFSQEIKTLLTNTTDISDSKHAREIRQKKEFQADGYGLLYATMAGYDPVSLINSSMDATDPTLSNNFFYKWKQQSIPQNRCKNQTNASYPEAENRAAFLQAKMRAISEDIVLFNLGVRLSQLGRYKDALEFLMEFKKKFPCREVLNDIGLIYYRLALDILARCDMDAAYRFQLSTVIDSVTRAQNLSKKQMRGESCFNNSIYQRYLRDAIRYFKAACEKDPFYTPSLINLSSAYIMSGQFSGAVSETDKVLKIHKENSGALNNRAVALYLLGPSINVDMFESSIKTLELLIKEYPDESAAYYNIAVLLSERKREAAAKRAWGHFIERERVGNFSKQVKKKLGGEKNNFWIEHQKTPDAPTMPGNLTAYKKKGTLFKQPVKLGEMDEKIIEQLKGFQRRIIDIGTIFGEYYTLNDVHVLAIEGVVEIVECSIDKNCELSDFVDQHDKLKQILITASLKKMYIYDNFAVDVVKGKVTSIVFYENTLIEN